jgi:hypothetical protein
VESELSTSEQWPSNHLFSRQTQDHLASKNPDLPPSGHNSPATSMGRAMESATTQGRANHRAILGALSPVPVILAIGQKHRSVRHQAEGRGNTGHKGRGKAGLHSRQDRGAGRDEANPGSMTPEHLRRRQSLGTSDAAPQAVIRRHSTTAAETTMTAPTA